MKIDEVRQKIDEAIHNNEYAVIVSRDRCTADVEGAQAIIRNNSQIHAINMRDIRWLYQDFKSWHREEFISLHDKALGAQGRQILEQQFL